MGASTPPSKSRRKLVVDTMDDRHVGKAMCATQPEGVVITTECTGCGRSEFGPIHPYHLRSMAEMLDTMADGMGISPRGIGHDSITTAEIHPESGGDIKAAVQQFEDMSMDPEKIEQDIAKARLMPRLLANTKPDKVH